MVEGNSDRVEQSTNDAQVEEQLAVAAPWQEQEGQIGEERQGEGAEKEEEAKAKMEADTINVEAASSSQEEAVTIDSFAGLGSVDEIAAAALQAANISGLFGIPEGEQKMETTMMDDESRGTKRSHDDMVRAPEEANEVNTSIIASAPAAIATSDTIPMPSSSQPSTSTLVSSDPPVEATNPTSGPPTASTDSSTVVRTAEVVGSALETNGSVPFSIGSLDLQAVAQAAMGLDADGNPLPGNEESHRALAEAVKQLSAAQGITLPNVKTVDDSSDHDANGGPVKRFQCTQCERAFARAYNLNTHLATHDPDPSRSKPFPCPYPSCKTDGGRSFSRKHDLQRHVASTHENEPEPVTSTIGENGVQQTSGLASLGLGTPGRKFRCEECGRAFVRRDALKRHQCTRIMDSPSSSAAAAAHVEKATPDYFSNVAAGLSLYTSNPTSGHATQQYQAPSTKASESVAGSSYDSDPFGPNGITYENLSKEVQDMAMQLVAQAQSYNDQQPASSTTAPAPPASTSTNTSSTITSTPVPRKANGQPAPPSTSTQQQQVVPVKVEEEGKLSTPASTSTSTSATTAVPVSSTNHAITIKSEPSEEAHSIGKYDPSTTSVPTPDPISAQ